MDFPAIVFSPPGQFSVKSWGFTSMNFGSAKTLKVNGPKMKRKCVLDLIKYIKILKQCSLPTKNSTINKNIIFQNNHQHGPKLPASWHPLPTWVWYSMILIGSLGSWFDGLITIPYINWGLQSSPFLEATNQINPNNQCFWAVMIL